MKKIILLIVSLTFCLTSWVSAQNAINFDGNNDIVQTNYSGVLGTAGRTFEAWVFVDPNAPSSNLCILDYGVNAVGSRNTFSVTGSRGLTFISGGTNANIGTAGNLVPVGQWTHVAFVLDNGTGYLYVNGTQVGSGNLSTVNTPANNQTVRIGQRVSGGTIPFQGSIDEVRVWSVARTLTDIQTNMNTEFCGPQPNLELYLKFNQGVAGGMNTGVTAAIDDSGNGHTATLNNFSLNGNASNWVTGALLTSSGGTNTFATISASNCGSYTLPSGSQTVTTSGMYMDTIPNTQCGDSILTINVTINNNTSSSPALTVCNSYIAPNGDTYTSSQIINYTIPNAAGCDSLISLNLTVLNPTSSITETSCGAYTSPSGMVVTTSQVFTDVIPSVDGCDSTITIDLTIVEIDSSVSFTTGDTTLLANETNPNATYQWYECLNGALTMIQGATNQNYTPVSSGFYAVEIGLNGCSNTSACTEFILDNTENQYLQSMVNIFPNPTNGDFTIDLGDFYQDIQLEIYSFDGKMIANQSFKNQQQINTTIEAISGLYQIKIKTEKGVVNKMILKE